MPICVCVCACVRVCVRACVHACVRACVCLCMCMCVYMFAFVCILFAYVHNCACEYILFTSNECQNHENVTYVKLNTQVA